MKYASLAIAVLAVVAVLRFLSHATAIDPCNPPRPLPEAVAAAPAPGTPSPTLAPALPPQYDVPAHVVYVTVEAELKPQGLDGKR